MAKLLFRAAVAAVFIESIIAPYDSIRLAGRDIGSNNGCRRTLSKTHWRVSSNANSGSDLT
jgi:cbb3-type cytochrome oxidase cytochrome c subunit